MFLQTLISLKGWHTMWLNFVKWKILVWSFVYVNWNSFNDKLTLFNLCLIDYLKFQQLYLSYKSMHVNYAKAIDNSFDSYS